MNELLLRSYETFDEIPEGKLLVTQNSNLMYVRIGRFAFIAREFVDSVMNEDTNAICKISYLNVKDQKKLLELEIVKNFNTNENQVLNKRADVQIIPLSIMLNIKGNGVAILTQNDVDSLLDFKEEYIPGKKLSII